MTRLVRFLSAAKAARFYGRTVSSRPFRKVDSILDFCIADEPQLPVYVFVCVCLCVCLRGYVLTRAMLVMAGVLHFNDKSSMLTRILKRKCSKCRLAVKMRCKRSDEKRTKKTK